MEFKEIIATLKAKGLRLTKIRQKLVKEFVNREQPLSASDLLAKVTANKTTIYRELETLVKSQILTRVDLADGITRFELSSRDHHHHLVCLKCKSITEYDLQDDFSREEKQIAKKINFKVLNHSLEFFGICTHCV